MKRWREADVEGIAFEEVAVRIERAGGDHGELGLEPRIEHLDASVGEKSGTVSIRSPSRSQSTTIEAA